MRGLIAGLVLTALGGYGCGEVETVALETDGGADASGAAGASGSGGASGSTGGGPAAGAGGSSFAAAGGSTGGDAAGSTGSAGTSAPTGGAGGAPDGRGGTTGAGNTVGAGNTTGTGGGTGGGTGNVTGTGNTTGTGGAGGACPIVGQMLCPVASGGTSCVNTNTSSAHCGGCNQPCAGTCTNGVCTTAAAGTSGTVMLKANGAVCGANVTGSAPADVSSACTSGVCCVTTGAIVPPAYVCASSWVYCRKDTATSNAPVIPCVTADDCIGVALGDVWRMKSSTPRCVADVNDPTKKPTKSALGFCYAD